MLVCNTKWRVVNNLMYVAQKIPETKKETECLTVNDNPDK